MLSQLGTSFDGLLALQAACRKRRVAFAQLAQRAQPLAQGNALQISGTLKKKKNPSKALVISKTSFLLVDTQTVANIIICFYLSPDSVIVSDPFYNIDKNNPKQNTQTQERKKENKIATITENRLIGHFPKEPQGPSQVL